MRPLPLGLLALVALAACSWSLWGARSTPDLSSAGAADAPPQHETDAAPAESSHASRLLGIDYVRPEGVDLPAWVQSGDDFIEGTVVSATLSWSPLSMYRMQKRFFGDVRDCRAARPVMDVVLNDVTSLVGGATPSTVTVRMGSSSWSLEGLEMDIRASALPPGEASAPTWVDGVDPLAPGTRIGGPIYFHASHPDPVFGTGLGQPIYWVTDEGVTFTRRKDPPAHLDPVHPDLEPLEGLDPDGFAAEVWAANEEEAPVAEVYRDFFRLHDPKRVSLYAATCRELQPHFQVVCADTGTECW